MYVLKLGNQAEKDLKKLDQRYKNKVLFSFHELELNPFLGEKMVGDYAGYYRIKIPPLRIIYYPDHKNKIIYIRAIGFRGGIYN